MTSFACWIFNANGEIRTRNAATISTCASANPDTLSSPFQMATNCGVYVSKHFCKKMYFSWLVVKTLFAAFSSTTVRHANSSKGIKENMHYFVYIFSG